MTDTQILIEQRDRLLDSIVDAHLAAELPGNSDTMAFARTIVRSALLGRLGPLTAPETNTVVMPALPPMQIPISPDPPVETVPEEAATPDSGVPGSPSSGEAPGKELVVEPSPATPKQRGGKREGAGRRPANAKAEQLHQPPAKEETLNQPDSTGAIFEARVYVLNCIEKRQGVSSRIVENLTGWDKPTSGKFIRQLMDEAQQKGLVPSGKAQRVTAGIGALLEAVAAVDEDEEPEDEELEELKHAMHPATPAAVPGKRTLPKWWSESAAKYCPGCMSIIQPNYYANSKTWESPTMYQKRKTCSIECRDKARKAETTTRRNFRPEAETATTAP